MFSFVRKLSVQALLIPAIILPVFNSGADAWKPVAATSMKSSFTRYIKPVKAQYFQLDEDALRNEFSSCPAEQSGNIRQYGKIITLPMPDGSSARFAVASYEMMEPELAAKWSFAKTYTGQGIDDARATLKADFTAQGFHYQVLSPAGNFYADPVFLGDRRYIQIYDKNDLRKEDKAGTFTCGLGSGNQENGIGEPGPVVQISNGGTRRVYRLAVAATAEYTAFHNGAIGAASAIITSVNRVGGVYELEVAVRFVLVANNNQLIYTNSSTDPYSNGNGGTMLGQNQTNINAVIGSANYDIGHVFSTGGGGIASLGSVCSSSNKARGVTGSPQPVGDPFDIDYVAHEVGHQFGGNHTFNSTTGSCGGGNRSANSAFEPGSGTTIMAYAGICGADDLQNNSNAYFHFKSFEDIANFITNNNTGGSCPVKQVTGNTPPEIPAIQDGFTIPINTPFRLTAPQATDAEGDSLTYCWEQSDLGAGGAPGNTTGPIIRSFSPVPGRTRIIPRIQSLNNNTTIIGEKLPSVARTMSFKLMVRDNAAGTGGVNQGVMDITVSATGGAFAVTAPNTNTVEWAGGSTQTVTWNPGSTASAPYNAPFVRIRLSTDGGNNYPFILADSTLNNGTASVTAPLLAATSDQCRVMVEALGNIFFDISNANFKINAPTTAEIPMSVLAGSTLCAGQSFRVAFNPNNSTIFNQGNVFSISLSNAAGSFANPQLIGSTASVSSDTIDVTLPAGLPSGNGYKIQISSSNPPRTGSETITLPAVNALAAAPAQINGPQNVCSGNTVTYSVPPQSGVNGFSWKVPAGCQIVAASAADSGSISVLFSGAGGELSAAAKNSCGKGLPKTIQLVPTQVQPASVSVTPASAVICAGASVTMVASPVNGGLTPQYSWLKNGVPVDTATGPSLTTNALQSGDVFQVVLISSLTCGELNADTSNAVTIAVTQPQTPSAQIESDAQADSACTGIPVNFLSTISSGGGTNPKYAWFRNTTQIAGQTQNTLTITTLANGDSVRLRLTVTGNCLTSNVVFSPAIKIAIVNYTASAGPDTTVCPGSSPQLRGTPSGGVWSGSNVAPGGLFSAPQSGSSLLTYAVTRYGCTKSDIKVVGVFQLPNVSFTVTADTLKASATGATAWAWYLNGNLIPGANAQKYVIQESGEYCCEATFGNTCSRKSACTQVTMTEVNNLVSASEAVLIWPVPADNVLQISWKANPETIEILNAEGRLLVSQKTGKDAKSAGLSLQGLPSGMYRLILRYQDGRFLSKSFIRE